MTDLKEINNASPSLRRGIGFTYFGKNLTFNQEKRQVHAAAVKKAWTEKGLL